MTRLALVVLFLLSGLAATALTVTGVVTAWTQNAQPGLEAYRFVRGNSTYGTLNVPPGFSIESEDSQESTIRRLRYPDGSSIVLQHCGCRIATLSESKYIPTKQESRPDRVSRSGVIKGSETGWREDVLTRSGRTSHAVAYLGVPKDRVELFDRVLDSFVKQQP